MLGKVSSKTPRSPRPWTAAAAPCDAASGASPAPAEASFVCGGVAEVCLTEYSGGVKVAGGDKAEVALGLGGDTSAAARFKEGFGGPCKSWAFSEEDFC